MFLSRCFNLAIIKIVKKNQIFTLLDKNPAHLCTQKIIIQKKFKWIPNVLRMIHDFLLVNIIHKKVCDFCLNDESTSNDFDWLINVKTCSIYIMWAIVRSVRFWKHFTIRNANNVPQHLHCITTNSYCYIIDKKSWIKFVININTITKKSAT